MAAAALALCAAPAYAQVSSYTALPPVKLTTVSHPWVLATSTDTANYLTAMAAYEPISGGTLLADGSQHATENNAVFGTGFTAYESFSSFFGGTNWRPAAFQGIAAFVGNGPQYWNGNAFAMTAVRTGPGLPIGFPFSFNNQEFDRIGISSQGWISFGKSADAGSAVQVYTSNAESSNYLPLANTLAIDANKRNRVVAYGVSGGSWQPQALAPYVFQSGYSGYPGSTLRIETIGTAPNRVCVVQWENYSVWPFGSLSAPDPQYFRFLNFQIRLHENGDKVEVRYGDCRRGSATSNNQVGLGGTVATDYNGWQRSGGWPTSWNGSYDVRQALPDPHGFTAMTANNQQMTSGGGTTTPDMLSFVWLPPACPQQASSFAVNDISLTGATLNWSGTGTFDWVVSPTNNPADVNAITGTTSGNSATVNTLANGTYYYAFVRTNCDPDFSSWLPGVRFRTFEAMACGSTWTNAGQAQPFTENVFKYTYVICPSTPGEQATIDFTTWSQPATSQTQFNAVFIHNGDSPAAPIVPGPGSAASCSGNCNNNWVPSWSIPAGGWNTATKPPTTTSTAPNGCLTIVWYGYGVPGWANSGWTADITCAPPPTCFPPTGWAVTGTAAHTASFSWNPGASPEVEYKVVAFGQPAAATAITSGTSSTGSATTAAVLTANTQYSVWFRGLCDGGNDPSSWNGQITDFRTKVGCGGPYSFGNGTLTFSASTLNPYDSLITICPDNGGDKVTLDFSIFQPDLSSNLTVLAYDGPNTSAPLIHSGQFAAPSGFPVGGFRAQGIGTLPSPFTSTHSGGCLTLRYVATTGTFNPAYPNFQASVNCAPEAACATPHGVTASNVGGTSVTISWTNTTEQSIVEYGPIGFTPGTGATAGTNGTIWTGAPVAGSPVTITGLSTTTAYDVYVRQVCGGPAYSVNSFRTRFTTSMDCSTAQVISCGVFNADDDAPVEYTGGNPAYETGNYSAAASCFTDAAAANGPERLYRFTATEAGEHAIITGVSDIGGTTNVSYVVAPVENGCAAAAFTCIGRAPSNAGGTILTFNVPAAGDYYILSDANYFVHKRPFTLGCPGVPACAPAPTTPVNGAAYAVNGTAIPFSWPAVYGATGYDIFFNGTQVVSNHPTNSISSGSYTTAAVKALPGVGLANPVTWRVVPRNSYGAADCPTNWTFSVGGNGAGEAIPLTDGVNRFGTRRAAHGYTNTNSVSRLVYDGTNPTSGAYWGNDVWYTFEASPCVDSVQVHLRITGPNAGNIGVFVLNEAQTQTDLDRGVYWNSRPVGTWVTRQIWDPVSETIRNTVPTWKVEPGERYYIVVDGYAGEYDFEVGYTEVVDDTDTDGDGLADCEDNCPEMPGEEGSPCYAGPLFAGGEIIDCVCEGYDPVPCTNDLTLEFQTDGSPWETIWQLVEQGTDFVVQGGGPLNPMFGVETNFTCLPDGCYYLRVLDEAGDGMTTGGYILRTSDNRRIIDNRNNFSTGFVSQASQGFCLPLGGDQLIFSSCDKLEWVNNKFIVVAENPAVSAQFGVSNANSGYEFWFFDPNGGYSFRRFRSHATSDGYGTGALRANHFKVNGWVNSGTVPHIPANRLLNVRVRGRVAGVNQEFGPACQFKIDASLAACPRVKLQDDPANTADFSCGVVRNFGGSSNANNRITANPPQPVPVVASSNVRYQFRFRIPGEGICIVRPAQTSARLVLNWTSGTALQAGKTYEVDVRVSLNGGATWCFGPAATSQSAACADTEDWGKVCLVTISGGQAQGGSSSLAVAGSDANLAMYPNPNRGDQLFVSLSRVEDGVSTVSVDIFDLTGKKVTARTIAVQDGSVNTALDLNGEIANGVYLVNITAGSKAYIERLVIQK